MIVDTSALIAVIFKEPEYESLIDKMANAEYLGIGTPTLAETGIVLTARLGLGARSLLARLLQEFAFTEISFGESHWREAIEAYDRYCVYCRSVVTFEP